MLEKRIIIPLIFGNCCKTFDKKQGSLFYSASYKYESSDGVKLRSKEECFWHYFLSLSGIKHTYEPNLKNIRSRPDFGVGNNFLLEIGGMVNYKGRNSGYEENLIKKREIYLENKYNIIEIYKDQMLVNGEKEFNKGIVELVATYNKNIFTDPEILSFDFEHNPRTNLYLSSKDRSFLAPLEKISNKFK